MNKKLLTIILSSVAGSAAVVTGSVVGTQVQTSTINQSGEVSGSDSTINGSLKTAKYSEKSIYLPTVYLSNWTQQDFEKYIVENKDSIIRTVLNNAYLFSGVNLTYVENSSDLSAKTAKFDINLNEGYCWNNNVTTGSKTLTLTFNAIYELNKNSTIPTTDNFINDVIVNNDSDFYYHFSNLLMNNQLIDNLQNKSLWSNVDLRISSVDIQKRQFEIAATPTIGSCWSDSSSNETRYVTVKVLKSQINSCSAPTTSQLIEQLEFENDADLNTYLSNLNFKNNILTDQDKFVNVSLSYVANSASLENKTFKILLTPYSGYGWSDSTNTAKEMIINLNIKNNEVTPPEEIVPPVTEEKIYSSVNSSSLLNLKSDPVAVANTLSSWNSSIQRMDWSNPNSLFKEGNIFTNVSVSYVMNSYSSASFYIDVKPINNAIWSSGTHCYNLNNSLVWMNGGSNETRRYKVRFNATKPSIAVSLPSSISLNYSSTYTSMTYTQFKNNTDVKTRISTLANNHFAAYGVVCYNTLDYITKVSNTSTSTTFNIKFELDTQNHFYENYYWSDSSSSTTAKIVQVTFSNLVVK